MKNKLFAHDSRTHTHTQAHSLGLVCSSFSPHAIWTKIESEWLVYFSPSLPAPSPEFSLALFTAIEYTRAHTLVIYVITIDFERTGRLSPAIICFPSAPCADADAAAAFAELNENGWKVFWFFFFSVFVSFFLGRLFFLPFVYAFPLSRLLLLVLLFNRDTNSSLIFSVQPYNISASFVHFLIHTHARSKCTVHRIGSRAFLFDVIERFMYIIHFCSMPNVRFQCWIEWWCLSVLSSIFSLSIYILESISLFCSRIVAVLPFQSICHYCYYLLVVVVFLLLRWTFWGWSADFCFVTHVDDAIYALPMPFLVNEIYKRTELPHVQMHECLHCTATVLPTVHIPYFSMNG